MPSTVQLTVTGMTCGGCENAVKRVLGRIDGVGGVTASHTANLVEVTFDPQRVTPAAFRPAIEALGYRVVSPSE